AQDPRALGLGPAVLRPVVLIEDVAESQVSLARVPDGAFREHIAGGDLFDLDVFVHQVAQSFVENDDGHAQSLSPAVSAYGECREYKPGVQTPYPADRCGPHCSCRRRVPMANPADGATQHPVLKSMRQDGSGTR